MKVICIILAALLDIVPMGDALLTKLQKRDSVLVADQIEYGFRLDTVQALTQFALPELKGLGNDTLVLVRGWQLDTTDVKLRKKTFSLEGSFVLAPFEAGKYRLPDIYIPRLRGDRLDTLLFKGVELEVCTMPVDTTTYVPHDIKGQIRYPLTFSELLPWIGGGLALAALVALLLWLLIRRRRKAEEEASKDPAHIVALRHLEKYRGDKFWAPEKQKVFYSGVTDTLKEYMEARFGVDAPEMTTAEVFDALKGEKDLTPDLFASTKELFETADFIKFAKYTAPDDYNAKVLPLAVRFVTDTYRTTLEEEQGKDVL